MSIKIKSNLDALVICLRDLLQRHNFSITAMIDLKAGSGTYQDWKRYTLVRCIYPRENILEQYLALPARRVVRCSILAQELSKTCAKIDVTRSKSNVDAQEDLGKLVEEVDSRLILILQELKNMGDEVSMENQVFG